MWRLAPHGATRLTSGDDGVVPASGHDEKSLLVEMAEIASPPRARRGRLIEIAVHHDRTRDHDLVVFDGGFDSSEGPADGSGPAGSRTIDGDDRAAFRKAVPGAPPTATYLKDEGLGSRALAAQRPTR